MPTRCIHSNGGRQRRPAPQALGLGLRGPAALPRRGRGGGRGHASASGFEPAEVAQPVPLEELELPAPRLEPPAALAEICSTDAARARRARLRQVLPRRRARLPRRASTTRPTRRPPARRGRRRRGARLVRRAPAPRRSPTAAAPAWSAASSRGVGDAYAGRGQHRPQPARPGARGRPGLARRAHPGRRARPGARGPAAPHGLTLRHFPQSFEFSTLGGWIATRSGGHYATLYTHIDDLVESVRAVTPPATGRAARLPGSGAGPSPDRLLLGSEGIARRDHRGLDAGAGPARLQGLGRRRASPTSRRAPRPSARSAQSGLFPTNCRLLDAGEAGLTGAAPATARRLLVLGFESADHPVDAWMDPRRRAARGPRRRRRRRATARRRPEPRRRSDAGRRWRDAVPARALPPRRAGRLRRALARRSRPRAPGTGSPTSTPRSMRRGRARRVREVLRRRPGHAAASPTSIPDGPAPYFTVLAPGRPRRASSSSGTRSRRRPPRRSSPRGGTITHHHAVGRDHRPWYDRQRPDPFARRAARPPRRALDPGRRSSTPAC